MDPVVTPVEMAAIDAEAPEPVAELIARAGWATAKAAKDLIGGSLYGKRVLIFVGKGNNGADGRSAASFLERQGAACSIVPVGSAPTEPSVRTAAGHRFDLVIDACFGTGLGRDFDHQTLPVTAEGVPVLAVDIPSGVDGLTGAPRTHPMPASATITFAALKPGLVLEPGRSLAGAVAVADIGLDCSRATTFLVTRNDITERWPTRAADHHKWRSAVLVVGGSPGMTGAPSLCATAALRSGAGYVLVAVPGTQSAVGAESGAGLGTESDTGSGRTAALPTQPTEAVAVPTPADWAAAAIEHGKRCGSVVVGPGLPVSPDQLDQYLQATTTPTVFDAGALDAVAEVAARSGGLGTFTGAVGDDDGEARLRPLHVLTPHDGEFVRLTGRAAATDRIQSVRDAAAALGAVVLLKGPTTVVAHPDGRVLLSTAGDQRLATAGTGDVLAGIIASGIAGGLDPFLAAGIGAELHGTAGLAGYRVGMTSGDLPSQVAAVLSE
jgi:NAD(P)H-hydrate epimerase